PQAGPFLISENEPHAAAQQISKQFGDVSRNLNALPDIHKAMVEANMPIPDRLTTFEKAGLPFKDALHMAGAVRAAGALQGEFYAPTVLKGPDQTPYVILGKIGDGNRLLAMHGETGMVQVMQNPVGTIGNRTVTRYMQPNDIEALRKSLALVPTI